MTNRQLNPHSPGDSVDIGRITIPTSDRIGIGLFVLILLSPALFKLRLADGLVLHLNVPILAGAWAWVGWVSRSTFSRARNGWYVAEWQAWNVPVMLLGLSVSGERHPLQLSARDGVVAAGEVGPLSRSAPSRDTLDSAQRTAGDQGRELSGARGRFQHALVFVVETVPSHGGPL
jgi:hypothetical protein